MVACRNCGQFNDDAVRICRFCGTSLAPQPQATQQKEYTPPPPYGWAEGSPPAVAQPYAAPPAVAGYRCPRCGAAYLPIVESKVSSEGMLIFVLLLFFCLPLCWIGLLMKQETRVCPVCHANLG
ncbi:MAG TPA: LITAF-like zinc ribbon domain-containing protein [Pyrinomonadaceae bacterium]|jgi:RNA polymerase subunit RPABC4/transcription elongation factor Spt4